MIACWAADGRCGAMSGASAVTGTTQARLKAVLIRRNGRFPAVAVRSEAVGTGESCSGKTDNNHDLRDRLNAWHPLRELQNGQCNAQNRPDIRMQPRSRQDRKAKRIQRLVRCNVLLVLNHC